MGIPVFWTRVYKHNQFLPSRWRLPVYILGTSDMRRAMKPWHEGGWCQRWSNGLHE